MNRRRRRRWLVVVILLILGGGAAWWYFGRGRGDAPPALAFSGPSTELRHTVVVPTLDTPIPPGKSAIWCGSFQLAWDSLKNDVVGEPVRIAGAEEVAGRLNKAALPAGTIAEENYYARAGLVRDGIVGQIRADMRRRFPHVELPPLEDDGFVAHAFAYLKGRIRFPIPY